MNHTPENTNRIGFHYFPDTVHFRQKDLQTWLPELKRMGAGWLTLLAPVERAIPEAFISSLLNNEITPILHFQIPMPALPALPGLDLLLETYARWGVRYIVTFDRPNLRSAWQNASWTQSEVVEQFLDFYLPIAESIQQAGLTPVFPPLEPGGDYWDTVFLQSALRSMQRRGKYALLDHLVIGAYAWLRGRPLDWGAGGPERWPLTYPYSTPEGSQDQLGFRIFDWYEQISQSELGQALPMILLRTGNYSSVGPGTINQAANQQSTADVAEITRLLSATPNHQGLSDHILASNFWLLSAAPGSPYAEHAWFQPDGTAIPAVAALRQIAERSQSTPAAKQAVLSQKTSSAESNSEDQKPFASRLIPHYLLVPLYAWGVAEWDLNSIRPMIEKYHPTVGFSIEEARLASRVTIAGGQRAFADADLLSLREAGCQLEILDADGKIVPLG